MTAKAKRTGLGVETHYDSLVVPDWLEKEIARLFENGTGKPCPSATIDDLVHRVLLVKWKTISSKRMAITKEEAGEEHAALLRALKKAAELTSRETLSDSLEASICSHTLTSIASGMGRSLGPSHRMPDEGISMYDIPDILAPYIRLVESYKPNAIKPRCDGPDELVAAAVEWAESNGMKVSSYHSNDHGKASPFLRLVAGLGKAIGIKKTLPTWRDKLLSRKRPR